MSKIQGRQDEFVENCRYLGLKLLAEGYRQMIDKANRDTTGYFDFINQVVLSEAAAKQQRRVEYLIKKNRLPQPCKMLGDFDFAFQPKLSPKLIMDLATLGFIERNQSILFLWGSGEVTNCSTRKFILVLKNSGLNFQYSPT